MSDNAFAQTINNKQYILFCPGFLVSAIGDGQSSRNNFNNIFATMAHEIGHHLDAKKFPQYYKDYKSCIKNKYEGKLTFKRQGWQKSFPNEYWNKVPTIKSNVNVENHIGEISADYWAIRALEQYFLSDEGPKSKTDKLNFLRETYSIDCNGSIDEGIHPSGRFRIQYLLRQDSFIHKTMSCNGEANGCSI